MPTFIVIATRGQETISARIQSEVKDEHYTVKPDTWFVSFDGTTQELSEKLGIKDGATGTGIVLPVFNFAGRGKSDMWEWLELHNDDSKSADED